uniref:Speckle-type POZ protein-like (inferred by orthology to a human protein) n=1 Tax=Strongyloides venezuelensis TaxID=75913 RepID=A0A0K0FFS8_STRVS
MVIEKSQRNKAKAKFRLSILNDKEEKKKVFNGGDTDNYWKILNNDNPEISTNITTPQSKLLLDYLYMLNLPLFTDCIIKVEDTEIKVHKAVLVARSPVFHNILNSTLEDLRTTVIEIEDFRVEVVREMLKYIYTNEVSNMQNMASEVLAIADKLDRLKAISVQYLCDDLTHFNVCERFVLSETYLTEILKGCCIELIIENAVWLAKTKEWKEFILVHPLLLESLFLKSSSTSSTESIPEKEKKNIHVLNIYPNGESEDSKEYVSVYLTLLKPDKAKAKYKFSILNRKEEEKNVTNTGIGKDFVKDQDVSNGLLINDKLTILCEAEATTFRSDNQNSLDISTNITIPQSTLLSNYANVFDSSLLTDYIIKVGDTEIKAHKAVLAAHSRIFNRIFNSTLEKLESNTIETEGFRIEIVKEMLNYVYKEKISNIQNIPDEMFEIATKTKDWEKYIHPNSLLLEKLLFKSCNSSIESSSEEE